MKRLRMTHLRSNLLVLFSALALMIFTGSALAGDSMMQQNCQNLSDLTYKWSNQLKSGKLTPEAQEKLAELLAETSQILKAMSEQSGEKMHEEHSMKIEKMNNDWDPFDTSDKM